MLCSIESCEYGHKIMPDLIIKYILLIVHSGGLLGSNAVLGKEAYT